jgi:DNA-binding CsgD family transcriptional regulator
VEETRSPRYRVLVLRAAVDVLIAADDVPAARASADELAQLTGEGPAPFLRAAAARAAGTGARGAGTPTLAVARLTEALAIWRDLDAPYEIADTRARLGQAALALGDPDGAQLELEAAEDTFERLGARPAAARVAAALNPPAVVRSAGLTGREVEVLRLVATGKTNRAIAGELAISEKTVARHLSNIFRKLDLPSRAAATAYAYQQKLI